MNTVRNIGIIAHVDHGKTTLVDRILEACAEVGRGGLAHERVLDSNDLERERGITILAKNTAVVWRDQVVNIVDTPGHADFGAEVERILRMVDSVLLLVDAAEGPMPQTRFVLRKSLGLGLRPIVVINKADRPDADPDRVLNEIFDLFVALEADEAQLDFPVLYASGRLGWAAADLDGPRDSLAPLLDLIVERVQPAGFDASGPLQLQVATLDRDDFLGRIAIGRIYRGTINNGDRLVHIDRDGRRQPFRVSKLMGFRGTRRTDIQRAEAGDIVALAGVGDVTVGDTLADEAAPEAMPTIPIDEPTLRMEFTVNDSPFAGKEGKFVTSRHVRDRLARELEHNVSLRVEPGERPESLMVAGRGTMSLSVLIETMRREGYELAVGPPQVITRRAADGSLEEPYEEVVAECPEPYSGAVIEKLSQRGGELRDMRPAGQGAMRLQLHVPSRGLIGYRSEFMTDTRGAGVLYHVFSGYGPWRGTIRRRKNGVLIVQEPTETTGYALFNLQDRGALFFGPGVAVYAGQLLGIHARDSDLVVNPGKEKKLTNIRAAGSDDKLLLTPPKVLSLEAALEFIDPDELVEVTPAAIRLRKRALDHSERRRLEKRPS
jgi:GTP-binding protein